MFFHGRHTKFVSGEKQGKEYIGEKESYDEPEKIELEDISIIGCDLQSYNTTEYIPEYSEEYGTANYSGGFLILKMISGT